MQLIFGNGQMTIKLNCPKCNYLQDVMQPKFFMATMKIESIKCVDCHEEFYVKVICLTRADELRNEAVDVGQGMASHTEDSDEKHGDLKTGA